MGEYTQEMHEEYRKEQDRKAAKAQEASRERSEKESARASWISDGGNVGDFERQWPALRDEGRRRRVVDAEKRARESQAKSRTSRI